MCLPFDIIFHVLPNFLLLGLDLWCERQIFLTLLTRIIYATMSLSSQSPMLPFPVWGKRIAPILVGATFIMEHYFSFFQRFFSCFPIRIIFSPWFVNMHQIKWKNCHWNQSSLEPLHQILPWHRNIWIQQTMAIPNFDNSISLSYTMLLYHYTTSLLMRKQYLVVDFLLSK